MRVHVSRPCFLPCSYLLTMMSFKVPKTVEAAAKKDNARNKRRKKSVNSSFCHLVSWRLRDKTSNYFKKIIIFTKKI